VAAGDGILSLREAIQDASAGDSILFDSSLKDGAITLSSQLDIGKDLIIDGGENEITISGNDSCRVYNVSSGNVVLKNLSLCDGNAPEGSGIVTAVFPKTKASSSGGDSDGAPPDPDIPEQEEPEPDDIRLTDIEGHWAEANIRHLIAMGAIDGYPDNTFRPDNPITRAEFTVIAVKAFGLPAASGQVFADTADHWARDYIAAAAAIGIVSGYNDREFGPDDHITREQLAAILWRYAKFKGYDVSVGEDTNILSYSDAFEISEYAIPAIQWACGAGLLEGRTESSIAPGENASRAEVAVVLSRFLDKAAK
jgi:hypothetical protein